MTCSPHASRSLGLVAAIAGVAGGAADAQTPFPTIINLGVLPTGATSQAMAVNADGTAAAGICFIQPGGVRAFRWVAQGTTGGVMSNLNLLSGGNSAQGYGISGDGSTVVGEANTAASALAHAFRWTSPGPMVDIAPTFPVAKARAISGNGLVVVGDGSPMVGVPQRAFRWTSVTGPVILGTLPGHTDSVAHATNADGSIVVGASVGLPIGLAFRWELGEGMISLGTLQGATSSVAYAVTSDGLTIAGLSAGPGGFQRAFVWTEHDGMQNLGVLGGTGGSVAWGVAGFEETTRVVGASSTASAPSRAFLWSKRLGMVDLNTYLPALGADLTGWVLERASAISGDGRVIVGDGKFNGFSRAWLVRLDTDSDADGLLDDWEINGVPYLDSTSAVRRFPLPGANFRHKDLYVEIDAMQDQTLLPSTIQLVGQAFSDGPVTNPSGINGINLHILKDEGDLPQVSPWATNPAHCWPLDFDTWRASYFGTPEERNDPEAAALLKAKAKAYRYGIFADEASGGWGGCGQTHGDDFVIFQRGAAVDLYDASSIMHELGHNLGLRHGGGDPANGKPNYPSVMNYLLATPFEWCRAFWKLDYSRAGPTVLDDLSETSLDEPSGIGSPLGPYGGWFMPFGVNFNNGTQIVRRFAFVQLEGEETDFGDIAGTGFQDGLFTTGVVQDLNYVLDPPGGITIPSSAPSPGQTLRAHDDWAALVLALRSVRSPEALAEFPQDELTHAAIDWINQNFPKAPSVCYPDCNADGSLTVADFGCFQTKFVLTDPYADCNVDGSLTVADFGCFQTKFVVGCP